MKTQQTKDMEQALIRDALRKGKHPALEVPYIHTIDIGHGTYWPEGQWEYIDAVIEQQGMFTCLELKVSISDLHSQAAQSYVGHKNYMVCPIDMAFKIRKNEDPWLLKYPTVGIMGWDGKDSFKVIKRCKIKYRIPNNDWITLAKGMILELSNYMKEQLKGSL